MSTFILFAVISSLFLPCSNKTLHSLSVKKRRKTVEKAKSVSEVMIISKKIMCILLEMTPFTLLTSWDYFFFCNEPKCSTWMKRYSPLKIIVSIQQTLFQNWAQNHKLIQYSSLHFQKHLKINYLCSPNIFLIKFRRLNIIDYQWDSGSSTKVWFLKIQYYGETHSVATHTFRREINLRIHLLVKKISFEKARKMNSDQLSNQAVWTN